MTRKISDGMKKYYLSILNPFRNSRWTHTRVGIQIGEKRVKIVVLKKVHKKWETEKAIKKSLPEGLVQSGKITDPHQLGFIIKELFVQNGIKKKSVSVFVEELPFFIRHIQLPAMSGKETKRAIRFRAHTEIPVEPEDLFYRYYPLHSRQIEQQKQEFVMVAVYRSLITPVMKAIHEAGLIIFSFGLEPESLYLGLRQHDVLSQEHHPVLIARSDTKHLLLSIFSDGKIMYSRYRPLTMDPADLEQEIEQTLLSWNGKHTENRIGEVILIGDQVDWDEVKNRIRDFTPLPVKTFAAPFTACTGVALKERDEINLYGDDHSILSWQNGMKGFTIAALIFVIAGGDLIYHYRSYSALQTEVNQLEYNIEQQRTALELTEQNNQLLEFKKLLERRVSDIRKQDAIPVTVMDIVSSHRPQDVSLSHLEYTFDEIKLSGNSPTQQEVLHYLRGLQQDQRLLLVQLKHSGSGISGTQFSIYMKRKREDVSK